MTEPVFNRELSEQDVVDFLRRRPDFFMSHGRLLSELRLPHDSGAAISLIERQVAVLRERNIQARRKMNELLQTARDNDELFAKTRSLTLALLEVDDLHGLNEVLATSVLVDFDADFVCCHLRGTATGFDHIVHHPARMPHEDLVGGVPVCRTLRAAELARLFPLQQHADNGSAVLVPIITDKHAGCLAIGSRDPARFSPDMDTLFVNYISDVLCRVLARMSAA